jgi:TrmH family RNA methyltransferase
LFRGRPLVVVLDGLQDPGNAGTIVRAAEAFGATGVVFGKCSVSPFNPKTLRASAGSLFRVPFLYGLEALEVRDALEQNLVQVFAATASGRRVSNVDLAQGCALIIGSEARGVSQGLRDRALDVSIPTEGVESLNAAMAASILLYEARRQRVLTA